MTKKTKTIIIAFVVVIIIVVGISYGNNRFFDTREVPLPSEEKVNEIEESNSDVTKEVKEKTTVQQESSEITGNVVLEIDIPNKADAWQTLDTKWFSLKYPDSWDRDPFTDGSTVFWVEGEGVVAKVVVAPPNRTYREPKYGNEQEEDIVVDSLLSKKVSGLIPLKCLQY